MATRRRSRFSTLTNTVSDINQRLRYVEKRRSYSRLAQQVVNRQNIKPKAVSTDQLANKSVTTEIIDDDAVTSAQIADGTIQSGNIGPGSIQNVNMGGGQVDGRVLADSTIESRHIKDGEVKEADIGANAVTTAKINGLAVTTEKINDLAVTTGKINGSAVTTDKINGLAVTTEKINGSAVTTEKINGSAVTTEKINNLAVTNEKLANDSVGTGKIRDLNVTRAKIANDAIDTSKLNNNAVTTAKIADLQITNAKIAGGTIGEGKLAFTPVQTVSPGDGLAGGGSAKSVTLRVDSTVSRTSHTHTQYAASNHRHDNLYSASNHQHTFSQFTTGGSNTNGHTHQVGGPTGGVIGSSIKIKNNISDYEFDVDKILNLNLKKFKYNKGSRPRNRSSDDWFYGYIAEELVQNGFEEVVVKNESGDPVAIDYTLVSTFLVELVKKQQKEINNLEVEVKKISEKIGK